MVGFLQLLICIAPLLLMDTCDGKTLRMVNLVFRHGARSPIWFYPSDPHQAKDWPDGAGRLTQKGMMMEYNLGKFLRKRYVEKKRFLNESYLHKEIRIRSSDVERTIQSAEAQLAALYPPKGWQVWNKEIPWQPVPIHTVAGDDVMMRPNDVPCARLTQIWKEQKSDPEYIKMAVGHQQLLKELSQHAGMEVTPSNLAQITDSTIAEMSEGMSIPEWLRSRWWQTYKYSEWMFMFMYTGDDELGRLLGGTLLARINQNMQQWPKGSQHKDTKHSYKMNMFSGHDTTILSLAAALGISIEMPNFSACVMIELFSDDAGVNHHVEMFYRNSHTDEVTPLKLKKCGYECPLEDFLRLTSPRTTVDRSKLCGAKVEAVADSGKHEGFVTLYNMEVLVVALVMLSVFLMLLLLHFVVNRSKPGKYDKMPVEATI